MAFKFDGSTSKIANMLGHAPASKLREVASKNVQATDSDGYPENTPNHMPSFAAQAEPEFDLEKAFQNVLGSIDDLKNTK